MTLCSRTGDPDRPFTAMEEEEVEEEEEETRGGGGGGGGGARRRRRRRREVAEIRASLNQGEVDLGRE